MNTKKLDALHNKITKYKCQDCNKKLTAIEFLHLRCNNCSVNSKTEFWSVLKSFQESGQFKNKKEVIEMLAIEMLSLTEQDRYTTANVEHYEKYFSLFPRQFLQELFKARMDFLDKIEIPAHMNTE